MARLDPYTHLFAKPGFHFMVKVMDLNHLAFWMTLVGTICWIVCFCWMHRISSKQNSLLDELREQARRIEKFSQIEHDLIKEVHPQVGEIKDGMEQMVAAVNAVATSVGRSAKDGS